jgi:hypothetical protein
VKQSPVAGKQLEEMDMIFLTFSSLESTAVSSALLLCRRRLSIPSGSVVVHVINQPFDVSSTTQSDRVLKCLMKSERVVQRVADKRSPSLLLQRSEGLTVHVYVRLERYQFIVNFIHLNS